MGLFCTCGKGGHFCDFLFSHLHASKKASALKKNKNKKKNVEMAAILKSAGLPPSMCTIHLKRRFPFHLYVFISLQAFYFPDHIGNSIGDEDDPVFYVMQLHYNNPNRKAGKH